jgi:hypothetical protein
MCRSMHPSLLTRGDVGDVRGRGLKHGERPYRIIALYARVRCNAAIMGCHSFQHGLRRPLPGRMCQHGPREVCEQKRLSYPGLTESWRLRHPFPLPARPSRALSFRNPRPLEPSDFGMVQLRFNMKLINSSFKVDFCCRSLSFLSHTLLRAAALAVETGNS